MLRKKTALTALLLLFACVLWGCASEGTSPASAAANSGLPPIPLKVAVVYNGASFIHTALDTDHDMGAVDYQYSLNAGAMIMRDLRKRVPHMFSDVIFVPDISDLKPGYLALIPQDIDIRTENDKIRKFIRCESETYPIRALVTMSLVLAMPDGTPVVSHSASVIEERIEDWPLYCNGRTQVGGAEESDYRNQLEAALDSALSRLETRLRSSGSIMFYRELSASMPPEDFAERWRHSVVVEALPPSVGRIIDAQPFVTVAQDVQSRMDAYLAPRASAARRRAIPQAIRRPAIPVPAGLEDQSDSDSQPQQDEDQDLEGDFEDPGAATGVMPEQREFRLQRLQEQFRTAVERRNSTIAGIRDAYQREIASINAEQEAKKRNAENKYVEFARSSINEAMEGVFVKDSAYEDGALMVTFAANSALYEIRLRFPMSAGEASAVKSSAAPPTPLFEFAVSPQGVSVRSARLYSGPKTYSAVIPDSEKTIVALDTKFNFKTLAYTDRDAAEFALQDPNLLDPYHSQVVVPGYSDDVTPEGFTEDLVTAIRDGEPRAQSPDRWLVAIGIESYLKADRILFADRSYTYLLDAAQKAFGIRRDHVLALADRQATSEAIGSLTSELAAKVKPGDTIYFYYSGHAVREESGGDRIYLLPVDLSPDDATAVGRLALDSIFDKMLESKPARIIAFLDAGVGGNTDRVAVMKGVRRNRALKVRPPADPAVITLVTACRPEQSANIYAEKRHRMFSYFLIRDLMARKPEDDLPAFLHKLSADVTEATSKRELGSQTPEAFGNTTGPL